MDLSTLLLRVTTVTTSVSVKAIIVIFTRWDVNYYSFHANTGSYRCNSEQTGGQLQSILQSKLADNCNRFRRANLQINLQVYLIIRKKHFDILKENSNCLHLSFRYHCVYQQSLKLAGLIPKELCQNIRM